MASKYPNGLELKYNVSSGEHVVPKVNFEPANIFTWSEPMCPVYSIYYQRSEKSSIDIFADEWVKWDESKGLVIYSDKFLKLNNTYYGELVG